MPRLARCDRCRCGKRNERAEGAIPVGRVLLIDAELLLVLIVGGAEPAHIERWHRTRAYSQADFRHLSSIAGSYDVLAVTPNVLTEVSNFVGQLGDPLRWRVLQVLAALIQQFTEHYIPSRAILQRPEFRWLRLTDMSIMLAAELDLTVLTADALLWDTLTKQDIQAINYNHLRFPPPY